MYGCTAAGQFVTCLLKIAYDKNNCTILYYNLIDHPGTPDWTHSYTFVHGVKYSHAVNIVAVTNQNV